MSMEKSTPFETFKEEAREILEGLEDSLVSLEGEPGNMDLVDSVFRGLHTIKGSGNMFDLQHLIYFTHRVENLFSAIRDGKRGITQDIIQFALDARDHIQHILEEEEPDEETKQESSVLLERMDTLAPELRKKEDEKQQKDSEEPKEDGSGEEGEKTYRIQFNPSADVFATGTNPLNLLKELSDMGDILVMGFSDKVPPLDKLDPETCYAYWDILLTTEMDINAIKDVFIFIEDTSSIHISVIDEESLFSDDMSYKRLGEILLERGDIDQSQLQKALESKSYFGEMLVKSGFVSRDTVNSALQEQQYVRKIREKRKKDQGESSIRVRTDRLDQLVNIAGEFVTMHARITQLAEKKQDPDFETISEQMEGLVRDVRDLSMALHMVPVETLFKGFKRMVFELSRDLGKDVNLSLEGTETELDKNVIDSLKDPLMHLVRNSIDHGIENPAERESGGKPRQGQLTLAAYYSGAYVVIEIRDDGKGLDYEKIRKKAVQKGLLDEKDRPEEQEMFQYIFAPGFSTAEEATNMSGRGVGMDVVKRNIESLRGNISLRSKSNEGTTTIMRMPLTVAIVDGLLAKVGDERYMINISQVTECLEYHAEKHQGRNSIVDFRGKAVPFIDLRTHFNIDGTPPDISQMIIVSGEGMQFGLIFDEIIDKFQSVIKPLGKFYKHILGISGAVILGDGTIALMLDIDGFARLLEKQERE